MKLSLPAAIVIAVTFIHTTLVLGLNCGSDCAACWKDNDPNGADIKFKCVINLPNRECGSTCPAGYSRIHCAEWERC